MNYELNREFVHKAFGTIGKVALIGEIPSMTLDGKPLPEISIRAILNHGLQILQDSYASSKSAGDAFSAYSAKYAKLAAGEISVRGTGDPIMRKMEAIVLVGMRNSGAKGKAADDATEAWFIKASETTMAELRKKAIAAIAAESLAFASLADA